MTRASRALGAALAAVAIGAGNTAAQESASETPERQQVDEVVATHGSWQVRCASEQEELCVMSQTGKNAAGEEVLELQIRRLSGAEAPDGTPIPAAVQVLTPLGVLLPAGVRIKVDANEERGAPFQTCVPDGCIVRQPMSDEFLNEMKAGANATITVVALAQQQEVPATISLIGFTDAFEAL